jgi:hypothetical protein
MWTLIRKTEIDQARQELKLRRAEILRRHAEESKSLAADWGEVEALNRLADLFAQKFKKPSILAREEALVPVSTQRIPAPVSTQRIVAKTPPEPRSQHHRERHPHHRQHQHPDQQSQTVFATFMRATQRV